MYTLLYILENIGPHARNQIQTNFFFACFLHEAQYYIIMLYLIGVYCINIYQMDVLYVSGDILYNIASS